MAVRKVCVVTGSRAEYGLLQPILDGLGNAPDIESQLIVTGAHLSPEFGGTSRAIEEDGYRIDAKVEMLLSSDTSVGIAKSIGLGVIGFADALDRIRPDLLMLLGDRYEILAAAQAALVLSIPVAHIAGGDITEGAFDDAIRHSITKMANLHFATNAESAGRLVRMGEDPATVHNVGSPGIDRIVRMRFLDREELERRLDWSFRERNLLVTYHPETLSGRPAGEPFRELLSALESLGPGVGLIFTNPNADPGGREILGMIESFVGRHANAKAYASLGQLLYLSTVRQVNAVAGNSSSGLYEVPSFKVPTVNIGDRQRGRPRASSVIDCAPRVEDIRAAVVGAFRMDCSGAVNPYGDGNSAERILAAIRAVPDLKALVRKRFHEGRP